MTVKLGWVLASSMEQHKGITKNAIDKMKDREYLIEGYHFKIFRGRIWYHYERFDELIENAA